MPNIQKAAKLLSWNLDVAPPVSREIQSCISQWIAAFRAGMEPPYTARSKIPGLGDTPEDAKLKKLLTGLSPEERMFAWALMWLFQDSMFSGLRISITGPRLAKHIEAVAPNHRLTSDEAVKLIEFFSVSSLDSGLDDELWKQFKGSKLLGVGSDTCRDQLLSFFLMLDQKRFGFSYAKVGRVLLCAQERDNRTKRALEHFIDSEKRGSSVFIQRAFRSIGFPPANDRPGLLMRDVLIWFASANTRTENSRWLEKQAMLRESISDNTLNNLSLWIRSRKKHRYFGDKPFRDDLFCRLWKSASWHLGIAADAA